MDASEIPLTQLGQGAARQHEMFTTWVAAGFTEEQALELLKAVITSLIRKADGQC